MFLRHGEKILKTGVIMGKIESRTGIIKHPDKKVFNFLSDFTNFNNLIPIDKLESWEATPDICSFNVIGIGKAGLKIIERAPYKLIKISSDENTPIRFSMWIQLKSLGSEDTRIKITIDPDVNIAVLMMVKTPLKNFIDQLVDQTEKFSF